MRGKLRCGVIGTGATGLDHLKSLLFCPHAASVAVAENDPHRLREATEQFHIGRGYADYHELLDQPDIDAVTIALPTALRATAAVAALEARKHVLLEAPFLTNGKDSAKIATLAQKMKLTVMVGQKLRFYRPTQLARAVIQRGELGEVYHARAFWRRRTGIPRIGSWMTCRQQAGGGCLCDLGVHILDACLHLLGEFDAVSVSGQTFAKFGPRGLGEADGGKGDIPTGRTFDVEDYAVALIKLKSGRTVMIEVSWAGFQPDDPREYGIDLLGTNGGLSLFPARLQRPGPLGAETIQLAQPKVPHAEDRIHHFVDCALHDTKPLIAWTESTRVQQILDAIYTSAQTGKEVRLR